jgi:DNA invertase Pin-like site-specific DNA recombinase
MAQQKIIRLVATNDRGLRIGESHPNCKYTDKQVDSLREMHEEQGKSYKKIAKETGIPWHTVKRICRYERRAQTIEHWKKVEVEAPAVDPVTQD